MFDFYTLMPENNIFLEPWLVYTVTFRDYNMNCNLPMNVGPDELRGIVVYNIFHPLNVNASGSCVSAYQPVEKYNYISI